MPASPRYPKSALIAMIHTYRGSVKRVARELGYCNDSVVRNRARRDPEIRAAIDAARAGR